MIVMHGPPLYPMPNGPRITIRAMAAARAAPGFMIAVTSRRYVRKSYRDHDRSQYMDILFNAPGATASDGQPYLVTVLP